MRFCFRFIFSLVVFAALAGCGSPQENPETPVLPSPTSSKVAVPVVATPVLSPTPFSATIYERYAIRNGDTLSAISARFGISVDDLMKLNGLTKPNTLQIGQQLRIPVLVTRVGPADKLLPNSEVVYGPAYATFDVAAFANQSGGYLATYRDKVDGDMLTGPQIIQLVAERYSVGPRVLLALLEFQSGWVTNTSLTANQITYPMGLADSIRQGLFFQASWAAARLNEGYYGKLSGRLAAYRLKDRSRAYIAPSVNPGTAAIQNLFATLSNWDTWQTQIGNDGFIATYRKLFGDPNALAIEPLIPTDLKQPTLRLPWNDGEMWYYTGGPHAGWGDGSGWSAIDFSPGDILGNCHASRLWAIAAAPGKIARTERGRVMLSLSNSDFQGNGWTLMYLHIATVGRVSQGATVNLGDRIGHPSCEGGSSESSHVHFARLYNGQWIEPDTAAMVLSGWRVVQAEQEYEGKLGRGAETREACNCRDNPKNGIVADGNTK